MTWKNVTCLSLLFVAAGLVTIPTAASAQAPDTPQVVFYELTENVVYQGTPPYVSKRDSTSALMGTAQVGTPLCPPSVLQLNASAQSCTVTAIGSDDVSLSIGKGTVWGTVAVVIDAPAENLTDAPEIVVGTGSFSGSIDLSPAILSGVPLGSISNGVFQMSWDGNEQIPFTGTFRLPFSMTSNGNRTKPGTNLAAFYLGDQLIPFPVAQNDRSLGWANVRFEVSFGQ